MVDRNLVTRPRLLRPARRRTAEEAGLKPTADGRRPCASPAGVRAAWRRGRLRPADGPARTTVLPALARLPAAPACGPSTTGAGALGAARDCRARYGGPPRRCGAAQCTGPSADEPADGSLWSPSGSPRAVRPPPPAGRIGAVVLAAGAVASSRPAVSHRHAPAGEPSAAETGRREECASGLAR
ncbi:hypothetical protein LT493_10220 [Streptomyces tricolor]|nr:hypothetical protein [Streptomyces tricolor]